MDLTWDFKCPQCQRRQKIRVAEMVPGRSRSCVGCGTNITFDGDDGRKVQRATDDLVQKLKASSKVVKLRL